MQNTIEILNFFLALGGVVMAFGALVLFFDLKKKNYTLKDFIQKLGLTTALVVTSVSTLMTLVYSEVFGFMPCGLCWFGRIFLYPQVVLLAVALWTKDKAVAQYGIGLSIPGLIVSLYHHYIQMGGANVVGCPTSGANCAERTLFEFGFMTFPLMSACLFLFLISIYYYVLKTKTN
jgi:disulfide bond formation protein DsbB